jgi:hypothetical protein
MTAAPTVVSTARRTPMSISPSGPFSGYPRVEAFAAIPHRLCLADVRPSREPVRGHRHVQHDLARRQPPTPLHVRRRRPAPSDISMDQQIDERARAFFPRDFDEQPGDTGCHSLLMDQLADYSPRARTSSGFNADSASSRIPATYPRVARTDGERCRFAGISSKPSDGLEPSTLPYHVSSAATGRNRRQRFRLREPFLAPSRLPPVATRCDRSAP